MPKTEKEKLEELAEKYLRPAPRPPHSPHSLEREYWDEGFAKAQRRLIFERDMRLLWSKDDLVERALAWNPERPGAAGTWEIDGRKDPMQGASKTVEKWVKAHGGELIAKWITEYMEPSPYCHRDPHFAASMPQADQERLVRRVRWLTHGYNEGMKHEPPKVDRENFKVYYCGTSIAFGRDTDYFRFFACLADHVGDSVSHAILNDVDTMGECNIWDKRRALREWLKSHQHKVIDSAIEKLPDAYLLHHQP